jgi:methanogenic corrinoid protein MtbC1
MPLSPLGDHAAWARAPLQRPVTEARLGHLVEAIERDIIPRLVRAHASNLPSLRTGGPEEDEVQAFTAHVLARDDHAIEAQLAQLRERGVSIESLFIDLFAPAARHLGALWEDDRCHFADVTIGLGRLQQLMRGLSTAFGSEVEPPAGGMRVLLAPAPGEQHTFGLSMVAQFFARAGWDVAGLPGPSSRPLRDRVHDEWFDVVGLSAGCSARSDGLAACIAELRRRSHNTAVVVMVGGPLFTLQPELAEQVGADVAVTDGRQAPLVAEQWLSRRAQGLRQRP